MIRKRNAIGAPIEVGKLFSRVVLQEARADINTVVSLRNRAGGACSSSAPLQLYFSGSFAAPNNTVNYYENADCSWLIQAADEQYGVSNRFTVKHEPL